jgi:hypothetical protein
MRIDAQTLYPMLKYMRDTIKPIIQAEEAAISA